MCGVMHTYSISTTQDTQGLMLKLCVLVLSVYMYILHEVWYSGSEGVNKCTYHETLSTLQYNTYIHIIMGTAVIVFHFFN